MKKHQRGNKIRIKQTIFLVICFFYNTILFAQQISESRCSISGYKYHFSSVEGLNTKDSSEYENYKREQEVFDSSFIQFGKKTFQVSNKVFTVTGKYKIRLLKDSCLLYLIVKPRIKKLYDTIDEEKMKMMRILSVICPNVISIKREFLIIKANNYKYSQEANAYVPSSYYRIIFKK